MAEEDSGQEKTEDPTPKRLRDAREKGDIPRSKELNTTALLLAAAGAMLLFGSSVANSMMVLMKGNFSLRRDELFDPMFMLQHFSESIFESLFALAGFFVVVLLAALLGPIALGGWNFSSQSLQPKASRMNPLAGLKRMFSLKALVELAKAIAKFLLVGSFAVTVLWTLVPELFLLAKQSVEVAISHSTQMIGWAFLVISLSLILISLVDVPFQLHDYSKKLKMTLQEVKDEMKNTEGKPEVKGRIRQLQREVSQRQMMQDIPEADVVITNPTHYAVALKYSEELGAPIMVAKGADFIALKVREVATEHDIPILSSPALARALYFTTEISEEIPAGLYKAVAQVLAYVFQLRRYKQGRVDEGVPIAPAERDITIPNEFEFD